MMTIASTSDGCLPYRNPNLPVEARIRDLLSRMTLEEMVRQMDQYHGCMNFVDRTFPTHSTAMAKDGALLMECVETLIGQEGIGCIHDLYPPGAGAINQLQEYAVTKTRLGIPILFSEEGLHGLCGPGNTIFPQAICLASTWNPEILQRVGEGIATEFRAYGIHETFSPVLDLAREPRWGRMEETFGEDTWLASRMAVAMVTGMQGQDLSSDKAIIAEPKHFAAYGVTRAGVNCSSAHLGERELRTWVLPIFEAAVREAGAMGMMVSYNSIDGIPCSGNTWLLTDVLRKEWGFQGFVRSDLGAINRLHRDHRTASSGEEAIRQSIEAGMDMQYYDYESEEYQRAIIRMVNEGRMTLESVDRAVSAILRVKFLLGLFENPYTDPSLVPKRVRCAEHLQTALDAAREGICLMKNEGGLLPLRKDLRKIAVIGPSAAVARMGDYTPTVWGFEPVTVLDGIKSLVSPNTEVLYAKGTGILENELDPIPGCCLRLSGGSGHGLCGEYFPNLDLEGEPCVTRTDPEINFNWAFTKPAEGLGITGYSVRWNGILIPDKTFEGRLGTASHDSMRLWVEGDLLVDNWRKGAYEAAALSQPFRFEKGREYAIRLEFRKDASAIQVLLGWNQGADEIDTAVRAAKEAEVAVVCVGDSTMTCGESRDRADLNLPGKQLDLVKAVQATGTPVVLVLQIGRGMTLTWEAEHIPAILNAWFPGEQGGRAVAEVLFGDINPAGRLPVTFPKSVGQLPLYYNTLPFGSHRYIDMDREPLFPFGHGLSYTCFEYSNLQVCPSQIGPWGEVTVSVDIKNVGDRPGDEVVQVYLHDLYSSVIRSLKELCGFQRIHLKPGETQKVSFTVGPRHLRLLDRHMEWVVEPGEFEMMVGGSSVTTLSQRFEVA
jgi:beta-glucosidase